jgi:hypothetical protein
MSIKEKVQSAKWLCADAPDSPKGGFWFSIIAKHPLKSKGKYSMSANPTTEAPQSQSNLEIEYNTLRTELLNRLGSRQQIVSVTLTLVGAFSGIGWTTGAIVLLLYPIIALLLAAGWAQNEIKIRQLSNYIRDHLESALPGLGWERYSRERDRVGAWPLDVLSVGGIFLLAQLLPLGLGFYQIMQGYPGGLIQWILLLLDIVAVGALLGLIGWIRQNYN